MPVSVRCVRLFCLFRQNPDSASGASKKQAVSFSIKYKEPEPPALIESSKAALPVDPESDEEEAANGTAQATGDPSIRGLLEFTSVTV